MRHFFGVVVVVTALIALAACASAPQPPTPTPATVVGDGTVGELAELGRAVYGRSCVGCHGAKGGGVPAPALIGAQNKLAKYGDAKTLLDYVSAEMPVNRPGELSSQEYEQLMALLLLENKIVQADADFDEGALESISLR
jgi:mono/diheme cytochrome c family protein